MNVVQIMQKLMRIFLLEIVSGYLNVILIAHIVKEVQIATVIRKRVIVILSLIFFPFTILICTSKACGKHVVRIFSVALLILGYIAMIAIDCFILHEIYAIILIAIYSFGVVINFAGVLFSGLL